MTRTRPSTHQAEHGARTGCGRTLRSPTSSSPARTAKRRPGSTRTTSTSLACCGAARWRSRTSRRERGPFRWPCRRGAWARAAPGSRGSPDPASRATSSRSWTTAPPSSARALDAGACPLHIPWDKTDQPAALRDYARQRGLHIDAMNSNTFQDQPDQALSYKFGSLSHPDAAVRRQAVEHNIECIEIGAALGSNALSVWIGDGGNFPGQMHARRALERYIDSMRADLRRAARRLARVPRAQALRAGVLLDRHQRLGHQLLLRTAARRRRR